MRRGGLFLKYAIPLIILVSGALIVSGLVGVYFSYQESKAALARVQHEKALAAAIRIEQFVRELEHQLAWVAQTPWGPRAVPIDQRRLDSLRLLRQAPTITEVSHIDPTGHEQLRVSRLAMDVVGSKLDLAQDAKFREALAHKVYFSPVYFRKESEPYMTISLAGTGEDAGVVAAEANLKLIWDVVSNLKVGKGGYAYVVDGQGRLIAHPDISLVLKKTDLSVLPQVQLANSTAAEGSAALEGATVGRDQHGKEVLSASAQIAPLKWMVLVDVPISEAFAPLYASIARTAILLLVGILISVAAALLLMRRLVQPIRTLQAGATKIGAGALDYRIELQTDDELQALGDEFNRMAGQLQQYTLGLEQKVDERTRDLREALEQQTATSDVLKAISRATFDLQAVLTTLVSSAVRLCHADQGGMFRLDDGVYKWVAGHGLSDEYQAVERAAQIKPNRDTVVGRAALERQTVQIVDALADEDYAVKNDAKTAGVRSMLGVPLMRGDVPVGVFALARTRVEPFTSKQIELVTTFADQALIAMENVRLLQELQDRNDALTETLEQQTATSEILRVISSSPTDLQPVLDAVVESAGRLCDTSESGLMRVQGDSLVVVAEQRAKGDVSIGEHIPIRRDTVGGRAVIDRKTVHVADIVADSDQFAAGKVSKTRVGMRTMLAVPMSREGNVIGVIGLARAQVRPFTDKQIELVQTFAAQAVIAIENVRLFQELRSRTQELAHSVEQFKALAEVSHAVNSSLDLQEVLTNIVARAVQLSASDSGVVYEYDEASEQLQLRTTHGLAPELVDELLSRSLRIGEGATGRAAAQRAPHQIPDMQLSNAYSGPLREVLDRSGMRAVLALPLLREGRILGGLTVSRKTPGEYPPEVLELLQTFGAQSALAIENARLFREIEQKSAEVETASKHKSQFLANMSHELRTPLNAILGYTELISDRIYGEVPDKILEVLERVRGSGRHLLGLINDVLDLSKIEAGQLVLSLSDFSVSGVVLTAVTGVESLASEKGLQLNVEVADDLPVMRGDERRLIQVLVNLLGNAIKFTEQGHVALSAAGDDSTILIGVADTGPGIAESEREKIFAEFQQADSTVRRAKGGTGLGLAIAKRIVEMHAGRIWVESEVGKGSTFWISIPVRAERQGVLQ